MKNLTLFIGLFLVCVLPASAQTQQSETQNTDPLDNYKVSDIQTVPRRAVLKVSDIEEHRRVKLVNLGHEHEGSGDTTIAVDPSDWSIPHTEDAGLRKKAPLDPQVLSSFDGMNFHGFTPADNAIAVSNDGLIVGSVNSTYSLYSRTGQLLERAAFSDFLSELYEDTDEPLYDPRVLYDQEADRFIFVCLHGNDAATTDIVVLFSQTNDPRDGWNAYTISGNVTDADLWTDYPNIAINSGELFVTGNMFTNNGFFNTGIIYQIDKQAGYDNAETLRFRTHTGLEAENGRSAFTPVPTPNGMGLPWEDKMYFVATEGSSGGNSIGLYTLEGSILGGTTLETEFLETDAFSEPELTSQKSISVQMSHGDARIQTAFTLDSYIYFAYTKSSPDGNLIVVNRYHMGDKVLESKTFGRQDYSYSYPAMLPVNAPFTKHRIMLTFQSAGEAIHPSFNAVYIDENFEFSNSVVIREGLSFAVMISQQEQQRGRVRWGDYTGIARKYNSNTVWTAGCYTGQFARWQTYVAEVSSDTFVSADEVRKPTELETYPNPAVDMAYVTFENPTQGRIIIDIYDMQGRHVTNLYDHETDKGAFQLQYNTYILRNGSYTLNIRTEDGVVLSRKVVVNH